MTGLKTRDVGQLKARRKQKAGPARERRTGQLLCGGTD